VGEDTQRALREAFKILCRSGLTVSNALDKIQSEFPQVPEIEHFIDFCRKSERGIARS
jgi:UDP-N-acetylglucosamine acyltransferase